MIVKRKEWNELTTNQKTGLVISTIIQIMLLIAALWDIRQRSEHEINGNKWMWTAAAFVNFVGPIAYFAFGRKK